MKKDERILLLNKVVNQLKNTKNEEEYENIIYILK